MLVYGDPWELKNLALPADWGTNNPLWIASYQPTPILVPPWTSCVMQQTSGGGGRLPNGCPVDTDVCVDEATLAALLTR